MLKASSAAAFPRCTRWRKMRPPRDWPRGLKRFKLREDYQFMRLLRGSLTNLERSQ